MLKNLLLALSATLVTLLLCEGGMRVVVAVMHRDPVAVSDAQAGWIGKPGLRNTRVSVAQGSFSTSTDRHGRPEMVLACLASMRRLGEANGARVHVFAHRRARRPSFVTPSVWGDFLTRAGAADITDAILAGTGPDPVGYDGGHWSREGHRRAANFILGSL